MTKWRPGAEALAIATAVVAFLVLRLAGLARGPELDDHDSNGYMAFAEIWRSGDWDAIVNMNPDATFFYPFLVALLSHLTGGYDSAGRLVSLLASTVALGAVWYVSRRIAGVLVATLAVLLVAVNPWFVRFSYTILTEPLYVALICLLLAVFVARVREPTVGSGALLGLLAGLAFLTRLEGVLFLAAIPLFQFAHRVLAAREIGWRQSGRSMLAFVAVFTLLAAPQIWRVSHVMETFSLNGRSVWSVLLNLPDGKSSDAKIYGLDFDPGITNLDYLQQNPGAVEDMVQETGIGETVTAYFFEAYRNLETLHDTHLIALVGVPFLAFSVIGFLALIRAGRGEESMMLLWFVVVSLAAPLLHSVTLRHIAVIGPILAICAGAGIVDTANAFRQHLLTARLQAATLAWLFALVPLASYAPDLGRLFSERDDVNHEYDWEELERPVEILKDEVSAGDRPVRVLARKTYLPAFAQAEMVKAPFADLEGLLRYIELNDVEFLFYYERNLRGFPFADSVGTREWRRHFELLHSDKDEDGLRVALYAVRES